MRAAIAVVPQEISLFHRSILENIRYGRPDATDEEVFAAARAAYCDGFIRELPAGLRHRSSASAAPSSRAASASGSASRAPS